MYQTIAVETDDRGVATLWLDRDEKHNALSGRMIAEIHAAADALAADDAVRAVILAARGRSFCAGGDLGWMRAQFEAAPDERNRQAATLAHMLGALNALPKPLIARVQGNCFGGGVGMVAVCDIAIGVDGLRMALTETRLGLIPATIGPYVAARMGEAKARRVFFTGRSFDAAEAVQLDLLSRAVPAEALDDAIAAEVDPVLDTAPGAVARAKRLLRHLGPPITPELVDHSVAELAACWDSAETQEGIGAFFRKEKPSWQR